MDSPIDAFREAEKIASEHYDDEGTFWFTTKSGKRIGVKKGQTLEDALNQSGIPKDDVDQSDVTGADLAKNEQEDTKDDDSKMTDDDYWKSKEEDLDDRSSDKGKISNAMLESYGMELVEGDDYEITEHGTIAYNGGFAGMLENQGFQRIGDEEIGEMIAMDEDTDVSIEDFEEDPEQAIYDYLNEKQNENTYNYSSAIDKDLNYGFIETDDGRTLMTFKEHKGGDVRGNYGDNVIYDITDFDNGNTGDPKMDIAELLDPRISATVRGADGKDYDVSIDGGMNGAEWLDGEPEGLDDWDYTDALSKHIQQKNDKFSLGSDVSNFVKETGTSVEDVRDGDHMGNDIGKTLEMEDGSEYVVYDNYDDAEQAVKENIRQQLEDEPELFNQSFIESHQTISETNARLFGNDFGDMMVEDRDLDELKEMADDYGIEYDEDVDEDKLKDELSYARSKEVTETILRDGLRSFLVDDEGIVSDDEFQEQYGKWLNLDIDSAVDDALDSDGLGHFLSSYDGDYKELKDGKVIARIN